MMAHAIHSDERLHSIDTLQKMLTNGNFAYNSLNRGYLPMQKLNIIDNQCFTQYQGQIMDNFTYQHLQLSVANYQLEKLFFMTIFLQKKRLFQQFLGANWRGIWRE